jgi:hypothetical protein
LAPAVGFGGSFSVFERIQTQFAWVIKQTLELPARTFSLRFAGNFAGTRAPLSRQFVEGQLLTAMRSGRRFLSIQSRGKILFLYDLRAAIQK